MVTISEFILYFFMDIDSFVVILPKSAGAEPGAGAKTKTQPTKNMQNVTKLHREIRKNLSDMLQGFVEHCEFSENLIGKVEFPIYHSGLKYGTPVFTHRGSRKRWGSARIIGLIGQNQIESETPTQILLQFIEILTQNPGLAGESVLRILPVADPVALERGDDDDTATSSRLAQRVVGSFKEQSIDGWIEIRPTQGSELSIEGTVPLSFLQAFEEIDEITPTAKETRRIRVPSSAELRFAHDDRQWKLILSVPASWNGAGQILETARFVAHLLYAEARLARHANRKLNRRS